MCRRKGRVPTLQHWYVCEFSDVIKSFKHLFLFLDPCEQMADFRAQQCQHLFEVVSMDFLAVDLQLEEVCL